MIKASMKNCDKLPFDTNEFNVFEKILINLSVMFCHFFVIMMVPIKLF